MKLNEIIQKFKELTEEEKDKLTGYKNKKWDYWIMNTYLLMQQGAPQWEFIAMSELRKWGYNFKWATVYYVVKPTVKIDETGEEQFRWRAWYWKVVHISQINQ